MVIKKVIKKYKNALYFNRLIIYLTFIKNLSINLLVLIYHKSNTN